MKSRPKPALDTTQLLEEEAFIIKNTEKMPPFLMYLITDSDVWAFIGSNHAISAGRRNPDHAIFPYYTQDKLFDMVNSTGSTSILKIQTGNSEDATLWQPFLNGPLIPDTIQRNVIKSVSGTKIALEEIHCNLNLRLRITWSSSEKFGVVRQTEIFNDGSDDLQIEILDGIQNILPSETDELFQNTFSNLTDGYKQSELLEGGVAAYSLSSIPTDKAEPNECLRATTVFNIGFPAAKLFLSEAGLHSMNQEPGVQSETLSRGKRGAYLLQGTINLNAGKSKEWWIVADVDQSAADITETQAFVSQNASPANCIKEALKESTDNLVSMVSSLDGIQKSDLKNHSCRHFSNTLFNMMRGGTFLNEYRIPKAELIQQLSTRNRSVTAKHLERLKNLPEGTTVEQLRVIAESTQDNDLIRLTGEYLPLSFSRRHGDPSRPWNRFSIDVTDEHGNTRYAYQGNWRDIFQNWEALLHSFPLYTKSVINRFLNSTTFDGYNPYRITQDGFDWEIEEPGSPWSNIGYWGDHQIVYLLKLLELSHKTSPLELPSSLNNQEYAYAAVPYIIKSYDSIVADARSSIEYDHDWSNKIAEACESIGTDGQLVSDNEGNIIYASLAEKLLVPLLAKMTNFVPEAGIWMNTQRPEWNDANNALAGYGASVVTAGYILRYSKLLQSILKNTNTGDTLILHKPVYDLLTQVTKTLQSTDLQTTTSPTERGRITKELGTAGSEYRQSFYQNGIDPRKSELSIDEALATLQTIESNIEKTLLANQREDGLYHSYNLLHFEKTGEVNIEYLCLMLEGQVSILSSGLIDADNTLKLLDTLKQSDLYRADQNSYLLYPNRPLPSVADKGIIQSSDLTEGSLLAKDLKKEQSNYIERSSNGTLRFKADLHNANILKEKLAKDGIDEASQEEVLNIYESTFHHHSFTGRSRSFFAFEGLGSIYWHMVSKLLLSVSEIIMEEENKPKSGETISKLREWYFELKDGIGADKAPDDYGAFPTDPYSHTPAHTGAQQPGMTGQVKEDFISRQYELGLRMNNGQLSFAKTLIHSGEFENPLEFSVCNTPVKTIPNSDTPGQIKVYGKTTNETIPSLTLPENISNHIFARNGEIIRLEVNY